MEQQPEPKRESLIQNSDCWHETVLASVLHLLEEECDGHTCLTTPEGRAVEVTVRFTHGGSA